MLPFKKPYMPKSTHTTQTHRGGSCTIKGFFALQEGSAHGTLKIGASPGERSSDFRSTPYTLRSWDIQKAGDAHGAGRLGLP